MAVDFVRISSAAPFRNLILSRGARWAHEATLQLPVIDVLIGFSIAYEETPRRFSQSWGVYKSNVPIGCQQIFLSFKRRPKRKSLKRDETPASSPWWWICLPSLPGKEVNSKKKRNIKPFCDMLLAFKVGVATVHVCQTANQKRDFDLAMHAILW